MQLTKHHGLGNDFCVAFVDAVPHEAASLARFVCDRHRGIGADGLIFATPATTPGVDLVMHLYNADGTTAQISGNGIRCMAQAAWSCGVSTPLADSTLTIESGSQCYRLDLVRWSPPEANIAVSMGVVTVDHDPVPSIDLARPALPIVRAATASVGNPHVVIEVEDLSLVDVVVDGPVIESHWLPAGINVHFLQVVDTDTIRLLHWERGVGVTEACGSGATVGAAVAHEWGLVGQEVSVEMPGGVATVSVGADATLTGPSIQVARIEIDESTLAAQSAKDDIGG